MNSKRRNDDIPIKIGGWDGKFVYEKPVVKEGYELVKSTRGTLDRQTWQDGEKVIIHKGQQAQNTSSTTERRSSSTSSHSSKEHIVKIETSAKQQSAYDANTVYNNASQDQQRQFEYQQYLQRQQEQRQQQQHQFHRVNNNSSNETTQNNSQGLYDQRENSPHPSNDNGYVAAQRDPNASNASNLHGYSNVNEVLPAQWDGKFPEGYLAGRPHPQQNASNTSNLYGYTTEPEILPARWDGKFPVGYLAGRPKPNQNASNASNLYGFSSEPTILPTTWDGKFTKSGETYMVPERNRSNADNLYQFDTKPTVLPTTWNGQFQLDPNDVRMKPERNASDVRDYADHRRFVTRE